MTAHYLQQLRNNEDIEPCLGVVMPVFNEKNTIGQVAAMVLKQRPVQELIIVDVVLGSRFIGSGPHRVLYYWHSVGNKLITTLSNIFTDLNLTDVECCYKLFRRDVLGQLSLRENRFGIEPEIVAKVARLRHRIYEVPVSYHGRTYREGKKIGWRDGFSAVRCIVRYNLAN